jgi:chemotaxis protein CheZ
MKEDDALYVNVGRLTRQLHDALRELGYDRDLESAVGSLPDARSRLSYISRLTGEAAEKVLNGVDETKLELAKLSGGAIEMADALRRDPVSAVASGKLMCFLGEVGQSASRADAQLTDIMLAQDFHDLTGQVIRKVVALAQSLETQLVQLLIASTPHEDADRAAAPAASAKAIAPVVAIADIASQSIRTDDLDGPVVSADGRSDVVTDQAQVDNLLESLGF